MDKRSHWKIEQECELYADQDCLGQMRCECAVCRRTGWLEEFLEEIFEREGMPFLYAGYHRLSALTFPTATTFLNTSPFQCASPPPGVSWFFLPLDQHPCRPNYQASAYAAGCDHCGDEGGALHELPLKKLPRPRSSSILCRAPSWAAAAASNEGCSTGEGWGGQPKIQGGSPSAETPRRT